MQGLQPDPRRVIPLDDKDHDVLKTFWFYFVDTSKIAGEIFKTKRYDGFRI
jgi:hypothetical protein